MKLKKLLTIVVLAMLSLTMALCSTACTDGENTGATYTVTLDANGGSLANNITTIEVTVGKRYVLPTPEREGYTFDVWQNVGNDVAISGLWKIEGNVYLIAKWNELVTNVQLDLAGGEYDGDTSVQALYGKPLSLSTPTKEGYTFTGWTLDGKKYDVTSAWTNKEAEATLVATWAIKTTQVTIDVAGGEYEGQTKFTATYGDVLSLSTPTKVGYTFAGWTINGEAFNDKNNWELDQSTATIVANWVAKTTQVIIDVAGGNYNGNVSTTATYGKVLELSTPTKVGYNFTGWTLNDKAFDVTKAWALEVEEATLVATWTAKTTVVTLDLAGGTCVGGTTLTATYGEALVLPTVIKVGNNFKNWKLGDVIYDVEGVWALEDEEITLVAEWELKKSEVTIDVAGGQYEGNTLVDVTYGDKIQLSTPTKVGYTFAGWSLNGKFFDETKDWVVEDEKVTLVATWKAKTTMVTLDLVGGACVSGTKFLATYDEVLVLPEVEKVGYTFAGWKRNDATFDITKAWSLEDEEVTLVATWTAKTTKVILAVSGGQGAGETILTATYDKKLELPTLTKVGYNFAGWTYNGEAFDTAKAWNIDKEEVTLVATWTLKTTQVTLDLGGAEYNGETSFIVTYGDIVTLPTLTKVGYTFAGWTLNEEAFDATKDWEVEDEKATLVANWTAKTTQVTLVLNNGAEDETITATYDKALALEDYSKTGYNLVGWTLNDKAFDVTKDWALEDEKVTLVAIWELKTTQVTLDLGGAEYDGETNFTITFGDEITLPTLTRVGYIFAGWTLNDNAYEELVWAVEDEKATLVANWTAKTTQVTLELNNGEENEEVVATYDKELELPTLTKVGYTFAGWTLNGEAFASGTIWTIESETATIVANWTAKTTQVTLELNNGEENEVVTATYGKELELPTLTKVGHNFTGWTLNGEAYDVDSTWALEDEEVTLVATWALKTTKVTIKINDSGMNIIVTYGSVLELPSLTKTGYNLTGWLLNGEEFDESAPWVLEDETAIIEAVWTLKTTKVTLVTNGGEGANETELVVTYGQDAQIPTLVKTGYNFTGWTLNDEAFDVTKAWALEDEEVTLVATWTAKTTIVTLKLGEGGYDSDITVVATYDKVIELPTVGKVGYNLTGWKLNGEEIDVTKPWAVEEATAMLEATWALKTTEVTLVGVEEETILTATYSKELELPTVAKVGYNFVGWTLNGEEFVSGSIWTLEDEKISIVANWTAKTTQVTLVLNNGAEDEIITATYDKALTLEDYSKTGYNFAGWTLNGEAYDVESTWAIEDETATLVATWVLKTTQVTLVGVEEETILTATYSEELELPTVAKVGYNFAGWTLNGEEFVSGTIWALEDEEVSIVANWTAKTTNVTLIINNGVITENTISATYDEVLIIPVYTKVGYNFVGWTLNDEEFDVESAWTIDAPTATLVANWEAKQTQVTIAGLEEVVTLTATYNEALVLDEAVKVGYTFVNWTLNDEAFVSGSIWTLEDEAVTIVANWVAKQTQVTLVFNNGEENEVVTATYDVALELPTLTKFGYNFTGWTLNDEAFVSGSIWALEAETATIVANWEAKQTQVTLAGLDEEITLTATYNEALVLDEATKVGYNFVGWTLNDEAFVSGTIWALEDEAVTIVANWVAKQTQVTLVFNNGEENEVVTATYDVALELPTLTKDGYTFVNWTLNDEAFVSGSVWALEDEAVTIVANWVAKQTQVTLVFNNGEEDEVVTATYDAVLELPTLTKFGYNFVGWTLNDEAFASGTIWALEVEEATIVANWEAKTTQVTLVLNGAEYDGETTFDIEYGQVLNLPTLERYGYNFIGWTLNGEAYDVESAWALEDETATLEAVWELKVTEITLELNGAEYNGETNFVIKYGETLNLPTINKYGYNFVGWTLNGEEITPETIWTYEVKTATITAEWQIKTTQVTLVFNNGEEDEVVTATYGEVLELPTLTKVGHNFTGWTLNGEYYDVDAIWELEDESVMLVANWSIKTTIVTLKLEGESGGGFTVKATYGQVLNLPEFTKVGYNFSGWTLNGEDYDETKAWVIEDKTAVLVAKWTAKTTKVTLIVNGGVGATDTVITATYGKVLELPTITKTGYNFTGWKYNSEPFDANLAWDIEEPTATLVATWSIKTTTITLKIDSDVNNDVTVKATYGQVLKLVEPAKVGYTFAGWTLNGEVFNAGDVWMNEDATATIVANWTPKTTIVTLRLNGGETEGGNTITATYGQELELPVITREGYVLVAWMLNGEEYDINSAWNIEDETAILTAEWAIKESIVTLELNGGVGATETTLTAIYGEILVLPTLTRTGYTFAGWTLDGEVYDENSAWNIKGGSPVLVANWTAKTTTLYLELNGGVCDGEAVATAVYDQLLVLPKVEKTGYNLAWMLNGEEYNMDTAWTFEVEEATLVAIWTLKTTQVTLNVNGGIGADVTEYEITYGDVVTLPLLTKVGYNFISWTLNGEEFASGSVWALEDETATLVANWEAKQTQVTLAGLDEVVTLTAIYNEALVLDEATKVGYTFVNWTLNGEAFVSGSVWALEDEAVTIVANWEAKQTQVTLVLNNGEENEVVTATYDVALELPTLTRVGYTFVNWTLNDNAYDVESTWALEDETATLVANWEAKQTQVTLVFNNGEENEVVTATYDVALELPVVSKTGYTFVNWTLNDNAYDVESTWALEDETATLVANWTAKTTQVTLVLNNGEENQVVTATYDEVLVLPTLTKVGYTFAGWTLNGADYNVEATWAVEDKEATLVANWTAKTTNVTLIVNGGEGATETTLTATYDEVLVLPTLTKVGYTFAGWTLNGEAFDTTKTWALVEEEATLVANWTAKTTQVTLVYNNGEESEVVTATYDVVLNLPRLTKVGYNFTGWTLNGEAFDTTKTWAVEDKEATLVANWAAKTTNVTLIVNGGEGATETTLTATYDEVLVLPTLTKVGYTFTGWKLNGAGYNVEEAWSLEDSAAVIEATWTINYYEVKFLDAQNENAQLGETLTLAYNSTGILLPTVPAGYEIEGGKVYADAECTQEIDLSIYIVTQNDELYVKVVAKQYTIKVNANSGDAIASVTVRYLQPYELPSEPTRYGYTFKGYVYDGEVFENTGTYTYTKDITVLATWEAIEGFNDRVVHFYDGEEELSDIALNVQVNDNVTVGALPTITKDGYEFVGWYVDATLQTAFAGTIIEDDITLYAKFNANKYVVTIDTDGGNQIEEIEVEFDASYTIPTPTKYGYKFNGYTLDGTEFAISGIYKQTQNITVVANWTAKTTTVTLTVNGGIGAESTELTATYDEVLVLPTLTKVGYTFAGWTLNGADYNVEETWAVEDEEATLVATWTAKTTQVTLVLNNGEENEVVIATYDEVLVLTEPTKVGYNFAGWTLNDKAYDVESVWALEDETATIVANWTAKTTQVTLELNGGIGTAATTLTATYDEVLVLPTLTKVGYNFVGWTLNGEAFDTTKTWAIEDAEATLVAGWELKTTTVTLVLNNGEENQVVTATYSQVLDLPTITKTGYNFTGWALNNEAFASGTIWALETEEATIVANWAAKATQVTLVLNNGEENEVITATYDAAIELSTPVKVGYNFAGWTLNDEAFVSGSVWALEDETATLVANWTAKTTQVTLIVNGGVGATETTLTATYDAVLELPTLTKVGYNFAGWTLNDKAYDVESVWALEDETATIVANWTAKTTQVTLAGVDAEILTATYDKELVLPEVSKVGYNFAGWTLNGEAFVSGSVWALEDAEATIVANWTAKTTQVTLVLNNGEEDEVVTATYDEVLVLPTLTKVGYNFAGWTLNGEEFASGTIWALEDEAVTIVANWTAKTTQVTLVLNNGAEDETITATYGEALVLDEVTKVGYTFVNWTLNDETFVSGSVWALEDEAVTIVANWTINYYDITFVDVQNGNAQIGEVLNLQYNSSNISLPEVPAGYEIEGDKVYADAECTEEVDLSIYKITENKVLYLKVVAKQYTIKVNANGGDSIADVTVEYQGTYELPATPNRYGFTFDGYMLGGQEFDITGVYNYTTDITVDATWTAKKTQVTLVLNGGEGAEETTLTATYDEALVLPTITKVGYTFVNWTLNDETFVSGSIWALEDKEATIVANWTAKVISVTFNANGGEAVEATEFVYGQKPYASVEDVPVTTNGIYTFAGWMLDGEVIDLTQVWTIDVDSVELVANWIGGTVKVTIKYQGVDIEDSVQEVEFGSPYTLISTRPYHKLSRLVVEATGEEVPVSGDAWLYGEDLVLIAETVLKTFNVTVKDYYGETIGTFVVEYGQNFSLNSYIPSIDAVYVEKQSVIKEMFFDGFRIEGTETKYSIENSKNLVWNYDADSEDVTIITTYESEDIWI